MRAFRSGTHFLPRFPIPASPSPARRSLVLLALLLAVPAGATVRQDPVKVRLAGDAPILVPGEPLILNLEVVAARRVTLTRLAVDSPFLSKPASLPAGPREVAPGAPVAIPVEVTPGTTMEPLIVRFDVEGETVEQAIDLSPLLAAERERRSAVVQVDDPSGPPPIPRFPALPGAVPTGDDDPELKPMGEGPEPAPSGGRNIRVRGRFAYYRSDGPLIGADRIWVRIVDEDPGPDDVIRSTTTDAFGYFDETFYWDSSGLDGEPDIYVKFEAETPHVTVQTAGLEIDYSWQTGTHSGYGGSTLYLGTIVPADQGTHGAVHVFTNMQRNFAWYDNEAGYSMPHVDVQWPDGSSTAFYNSYWEEVHLGSDRTWREDTHAHELGHHFVNNYADFEDPEYCNGFCDEGACGHCIWCVEDIGIAFGEGWPNWIAHVQTSSYAADYGLASQFTRDQESVQTCDGSVFHDPFQTEGFIGAVLQDIWDAAQDTDPNGLGQMDALALGHDEIFHVLDTAHPTSPLGFMHAFKLAYPSATVGLWQTALNNRWQLDTQAPTPITGLTSTTHTPNTASLNNQIIVTWNASTDDWSGIVAYDLIIDRPAPQPDTSFVLTTSPIAGTYPLPSGTYTLKVRARDRAGRTTGYASAGPYVIQTPIPADLTWTQPAGWARPLVARPFNNATANSVPEPAALSGDVNTTWMNFACLNAGQQTYTFPPTPGALSMFVVDGVVQGQLTPRYDPGPGEVDMTLNAGPFTVRGGRHTIGMHIDWQNWWYEGDETNNLWGHQWVWTCTQLNGGQPVRRAAPPLATGGWNSVRDGSPVFYNCDGLRFLGNAAWSAVWIAPDADSSNYDLRLHDQSTGASNGFALERGASLRGPGCLDVVVVNRTTAGLLSWEVGVTNHGANDPAPYVIGLTQASFNFLNLHDSTTVTLPDSAYVILREVNLSAAQLGQVTVTVTGDPADGPFHAAWIDRAFVTGGLTGGFFPQTSDATGQVRFILNPTTAGSYGLLVYRDPKDGRGSRDLVLELEPTPPDLAYALTRGGWAAPLVPRAAADGTPTTVPMPASLPGDTASTFLNWHGVNSSPVSAPAGVPVRVYRDGLVLNDATTPALGPGAHDIVNQTVPVTVPGGRHTLSFAYDPGQILEELKETNNGWGEQFIWTPATVTAGTAAGRPAPPPATGGWEQITTGEPKLQNCDGVRIPVLSNGPAAWGGVALLPDPGDDVDLHLYEIATGAKAGFTGSLVISAGNPGEAEYVLADFQATARRELDAGAVNVNGGTGDYRIQAESAERAAESTGFLGSFTLGAGEVFALHEVVLSPATYHLRLHNLGAADLGLSVHAPGEPFQPRSEALASAWHRGSGGNEDLEFQVTEPGVYVFPVWRVGAADLGTAGPYDLELTSPATAVADEGAPAATRLARVGPNPFRHSTRIAYELSGHGEFTVRVYDLRGVAIRTLAEGARDAGRYEVAWAGEGDDGRQVPAGIYFVRLEAGEVRMTGRVVKTQ